MATELETQAIEETSARERSLPPLENGDHLTGPEFLRRWDDAPELNHAELVDGVVHMAAAAVSFESHGKPHFQLSGWLWTYQVETPVVDGGDNTTIELDVDNYPQPDLFLRVRPEFGGQSRTENQNVVGAPELICEIAASSVSFDLHAKRDLYRRHNVREYIVWRVHDEAIDWFINREGRFEPLPLTDGLFQSEQFPGLWLNPAAMLGGEMPRVLEVLREGLATPEHTEFLKRRQRND